jgi:putative ABC transport system permease protein
VRSSVILGLRRLRRTPVFTVTTVVSLGLGIGLASSVAAVLEGALRPSLPYAEADRLVELLPTARAGSQQPSDFGIPTDLMFEWVATDFRAIEEVAGEGLSSSGELEFEGGAQRVDVRPISGDWFGTLGVPAQRGRLLGPADLEAGAQPALVASDRFWRDHLSAAPDAVGQSIQISGLSYVLVGILPSSFTPHATAWVSREAERGPSAYRAIARLRDGSSASDATTELTRAVSLIHEARGGAVAIPMLEAMEGADRSRLWILVGVVGAALLIAIINLTNLFLVRAQAGRADLAIRRSLGATSRDLVRGTVEDSVLVGLGGAVVGLVLTWWGSGIAFQVVGGARLSPNVFGFSSVAVAIAIPLLIAAVVALQELRGLSREPLSSVLQRQSGGASGTARDRRARNGLVAIQVAASVVLIVTGTMLGFAYNQYRSLDLGYDLERAVLLVPDYDVPGMDRQGQWEFASQVSERLSPRAEVSGVGLLRVNFQPFPPRPEAMLRIDKGAAGVERLQARGSFYEVNEDFFGVAGVRLTTGRGFTAEDRAGAPAVAIVNDAAVRMWWSGEDPIGRQVQLGEGGAWLTVVGTVDATHAPTAIGRLVRAQGLSEEPLLFRPIQQSAALPPGWENGPSCPDITGGCGNVHLLIQPTAETGAAMRVVTEEVAQATPTLQVAELQRLLNAQLGIIGGEILLMNRVVNAAGLVGILLGLLGIVGVVSDGVVRRTREIGLRMALGARAPQIVAAIGREAVLTAMVGLGIGVMTLFVLSQNLARIRLFELMITRWELVSGPLSPAVLVVALGGLSLVVFATAGLTALRALRVDPAVALRSE